MQRSKQSHPRIRTLTHWPCDGYDYMDEKRQALETLFGLLDEAGFANMTHITKTYA